VNEGRAGADRASGGPHRAVRGAVPAGIPTPVESGPVAVLPDPDLEPAFAAAVTAAGGVVAPLSDATRGVVWTSASGDDELQSVLLAHPGITWVQLPWAGIDAFGQLVTRFRDDGRVWTSAKGAYAQPVAEHALMLLLAVLREVPRRVRADRWQPDERGRSLYGIEVVIVGAGGIAVELLRLLAPFEVRATIVRRSDAAVPGAHRTVTVDRLHEALEGADALVIAAALTAESEGLVDAAELELLAPGALLVNVARGAIVQTDALVAALESGRLGGAGLDVTDPEPLPEGHRLWHAANCIITPHVADTEAMTVPLFAERLARNTAAFLGTGRFEGRIDTHAGY
jgi:phosphoglycerate dehydrogenase-like enzyme